MGLEQRDVLQVQRKEGKPREEMIALEVAKGEIAKQAPLSRSTYSLGDDVFKVSENVLKLKAEASVCNVHQCVCFKF